MTKEEILAKYGDLPLTFDSYYKYSFYFSATAEDGSKVSVSVGGNHDDIYRYSVDTNTRETLKSPNWNYAAVRKDDVELWSESSW